MMPDLGASPCPTCGRSNDAVSGATPSAIIPTAGDVTVCIGCASIAVFAPGPSGLIQRLPTEAEAVEFASDPEVQRVVAAIRAVQL